MLRHTLLNKTQIIFHVLSGNANSTHWDQCSESWDMMFFMSTGTGTVLTKHLWPNITWRAFVDTCVGSKIVDSITEFCKNKLNNILFCYKPKLLVFGLRNYIVYMDTFISHLISLSEYFWYMNRSANNSTNHTNNQYISIQGPLLHYP